MECPVSTMWLLWSRIEHESTLTGVHHPSAGLEVEMERTALLWWRFACTVKNRAQRETDAANRADRVTKRIERVTIKTTS